MHRFNPLLYKYNDAKEITDSWVKKTHANGYSATSRIKISLKKIFSKKLM
jgi:hypothetical protein